MTDTAKGPWLNDDEMIGFKSLGRGVKISRDAHIFGRERIEIGDNVRIDLGARLLCAKGQLAIGNHVHIATGALLLAGGMILIDDFCAVGFDSKLISASDNFQGDHLIGPIFDADLVDVRTSPIRMGRFAVLGSGCTVMPGCYMADGSALGANSLLKQSTKEWTIYAGQPAKEIAQRRRKMESLAKEWEARWALKHGSPPRQHSGHRSLSDALPTSAAGAAASTASSTLTSAKPAP